MQSKFAEFIKVKIGKGYLISSISGITVSKDGEKLASHMCMKRHSTLKVGYSVFRSNIVDISRFVYGKITFGSIKLLFELFSEYEIMSMFNVEELRGLLKDYFKEDSSDDLSAVDLIGIMKSLVEGV